MNEQMEHMRVEVQARIAAQKVRLYLRIGDPLSPDVREIDVDMPAASFTHLVELLKTQQIDDQDELGEKCLRHHVLVLPSAAQKHWTDLLQRGLENTTINPAYIGADIGAGIASTVEPAPAITGPEPPRGQRQHLVMYDEFQKLDAWMQIEKRELGQEVGLPPPQPTPAPEPEQKVKWREFL